MLDWSKFSESKWEPRHPLHDLRSQFLSIFRCQTIDGKCVPVNCRPWCVKEGWELLDRMKEYKNDPKYDRYTKGLDPYIEVLKNTEYVGLENYGFITTKQKGE